MKLRIAWLVMSTFYVLFDLYLDKLYFIVHAKELERASMKTAKHRASEPVMITYAMLSDFSKVMAGVTIFLTILALVDWFFFGIFSK